LGRNQPGGGYHHYQTQASSPMKKFENFMQEHIQITQGINARGSKAPMEEYTNASIKRKESTESLSKYNYTGGSPVLSRL
jgi:hypothetical protein